LFCSSSLTSCPLPVRVYTQDEYDVIEDEEQHTTNHPDPRKGRRRRSRSGRENSGLSSGCERRKTYKTCKIL